MTDPQECPDCLGSGHPLAEDGHGHLPYELCESCLGTGLVSGEGLAVEVEAFMAGAEFAHEEAIKAARKGKTPSYLAKAGFNVVRSSGGAASDLRRDPRSTVYVAPVKTLDLASPASTPPDGGRRTDEE